MGGNGLRSHSVHVDQRQDVRKSFRRVVPSSAAANAVSGNDPEDVESKARDYLDRAFASEELPEITNESINGERSTFEMVTMDHSKITNTSIVRFTQSLSGVPIFGSAITVELDQDNELLALSSALGEPHGVSPSPSISPESAQGTVRQYAQPPVGFELPEPVLNYYYETESENWRLAFLLTDVAGSSTGGADVPLLADYVVDAHSGEVIAVLARMCAANGVDALNRPRQFETSFDVVTAGQELRNATLNIITRDFRFQDIGASTANLPGQNLVAPPLPYNPAAVSAHANAEIVARFFLEVLNRRGPDGRSGPFVSSINCVCVQLGSHGQEWLNSFWINHQVVYGQRQFGGQFRSFAAALDMVAHEFFHGVTEANPPRLVYQNETGALNESYSDIFGVLVANGLNPNWAAWQWQIGRDTGQPLRDMSAPARFDQPDHMAGFRRVPPNTDFGGVHVNSGIHNKAVFNIMTARDAQNRFLFSPRFIAQLVYSSLAHLGSTALFSDSRRAVELTASTMLRTDSQKAERLSAISQGFAAVGIA